MKTGPMKEPVALGCRDVTPLVADYLRGEVPDPERRRVAGHLNGCPSCRARVLFERRLAEALRELREESVSPALERRVRKITAIAKDRG